MAVKKTIPKKTVKTQTATKKKIAAKKEQAPKVKLVGITELAGLIGVTERRIQQIEQEGVIKSEPKKNNKDKREYEFVRTIINIAKYYREKSDSRRSHENEGLTNIRLQREEAKLKTELLELAELEKDLHRTADFQRLVGLVFSRLRINLLAMPMSVAPLLRDEMHINQKAKIIEERIYKALEEIANMDIEKALSEEKD